MDIGNTKLKSLAYFRPKSCIKKNTMPNRVLSSLDLAALKFGTLDDEKLQQDTVREAFNLLVYKFPRSLTTGVPNLGRKSIHTWLAFVKTLDTISANGVIAVGRLLHTSLRNQQVILKTARQNANVDPIEYEFVIQAALNELRPRIPHFTFAFALFRCPTTLRKSGFNNRRKKYTYKVAQFCRGFGAPAPFLMIEQVDPGTSLRIAMHAMTAPMLLSHVCQVLFALQIAQDQFDFTHYDLHGDNVLAQSLGACCGYGGPPSNLKKPVIFMYQYEGRNYAFAARYLAMIIDFGRSYMKEAARRKVGRRKDQTGGPQLPSSVWNNKKYMRSWHGQFGVNLSKPNYVFDMVRYFNSVYDTAPSRLRNDPTLKRLRALMSSEFPDYNKNHKFTERSKGKNGILNRPFDLIKEILKTRVTDEEVVRTLKRAYPRLQLRGPGTYVFYWNFKNRRSYTPVPTTGQSVVKLLGRVLEGVRNRLSRVRAPTVVPPDDFSRQDRAALRANATTSVVDQ